MADPYRHSSLYYSAAISCASLAFCVATLSAFLALNVGLDVNPQVEKYEPDYSVYHNLTEILDHVKSLMQKYGEYMYRSEEYKSRMGKSQILIRISNFSSEKTAPHRIKIFLAYGEHAREFFPVESMFYFIKNLTAGLDKNLQGTASHTYSTWVLNNFDLFIVAMANPDGREHIEQSKNYCWRGTSAGVDINRNFDWNFGDHGSSKDPQDGEYRGPYAFSEPETEIFKHLSDTFKFDAFVSFHSGIRHIYIPFADSKSKHNHRVPDNYENLLELAKQMATSSPTRPFQYGLAYNLIGYTADGTSFDYMQGVAKVPFSLAIELWENKNHVGRSCFDEFNPEGRLLEEEVSLVHPLYVELLTYLYLWKRRHVGRDILEMTGDSKLDLRKSEDVVSHSLQSKSSPLDQPSAFSESHTTFVLFSIFSLICVALGGRHICSLMRKKRIISLKALSSTFSLCKSL